MSRIKQYSLLFLILAVGLFLRLYHNTDISLWHDEAFSALLIKYPWGEMFYRIGLDVHPPVYYVALRLWSYGLGDSLLSLRGFSIFFGLLTALGAYGLVKAAFNSTKAALFAALLVAISPFQLQYATEARMYTFGAFLAVLAAYCLVKALQTLPQNSTVSTTPIPNQTEIVAPVSSKPQQKSYPWIWWIAFGLTAGLATLTHYFLLFSIAALCFYALAWHFYYYRFDFKRYYLLLTAYLLTALVFAPWFTWFLYQYKQVGAGYWIPPLDRWSIPTTLWQMFIGMEVGLCDKLMRTLQTLLGLQTDISHAASQTLIVLVTVFSLYFFYSFIRKTSASYKWLVLLATLAPFGGALLFALLAKLKGQDSSVYLVRYFLYAATFYTIALAVWFSSLKSKSFFYLLFTAYCLASLGSFAYFWNDLQVQTKPGMAAAVQYMRTQVSPTDKLYVGSSFEYFNLKYYLSQTPPPEKDAVAKPSMISRQYALEDLTEEAPVPTRLVGWPKPLLFSGGQTTTHNMPHFAGTAILTDSDLLPYFEQGAASGETVWLLWTNGFGGSKPTTPANWKQVDERGFAEVRPYVGTWIIVTKYMVN